MNHFPAFQRLDDLGFLLWDPSNLSAKKYKDVTIDEICDGLGGHSISDSDVAADKKVRKLAVKLQNSNTTGTTAKSKKNSTASTVPPLLLDDSNWRRLEQNVLPLDFRAMRGQPCPNSFPFNAGYLVPLYVAVCRGLRLDAVDFLLGGSTLDVLANQRIERDDRGKANYC